MKINRRPIAETITEDTLILPGYRLSDITIIRSVIIKSIMAIANAK
jgi:hypothetical protein